MKILNLILLLIMSTFLFGFLPIKTTIKADHFRFENFKRDKSVNQEFVHLMCFEKKPTSWAQPKQYPAGKHLLWVKALTYRQGVPASEKNAFAKFEVQLEAGKSYMLNRKIEGEQISIWIQEVETGNKVSTIEVTELKRPLLEEYQLRKDQCRLGSI